MSPSPLRAFPHDSACVCVVRCVLTFRDIFARGLPLFLCSSPLPRSDLLVSLCHSVSLSLFLLLGSLICVRSLFPFSFILCLLISPSDNFCVSPSSFRHLLAVSANSSHGVGCGPQHVLLCILLLLFGYLIACPSPSRFELCFFHLFAGVASCPCRCQVAERRISQLPTLCPDNRCETILSHQAHAVQP